MTEETIDITGFYLKYNFFEIQNLGGFGLVI